MAARRTPVLAGNWKLHHGPAAARAFFEAFLAAYPERADRRVVVFPTALAVGAAVEATRARADVQIGVQNVYWEAKGAFTGEISAPLAQEAGATVALVGHSERRALFGETIEQTVRKVQAVLAAGLEPMLCIGETIEERRAGRAEAVVAEQLQPVLWALSGEQLGRLRLAYEPVWAIGTGMTATAEDAQQMHAAIRALVASAHGPEAAAAMPILYGGSVKPENAAELMAQPDVDGVLVGGASLDAGGFARICEAAPA